MDSILFSFEDISIKFGVESFLYEFMQLFDVILDIFYDFLIDSFIIN